MLSAKPRVAGTAFKYFDPFGIEPKTSDYLSGHSTDWYGLSGVCYSYNDGSHYYKQSIKLCKKIFHILGVYFLYDTQPKSKTVYEIVTYALSIYDSEIGITEMGCGC